MLCSYLLAQVFGSLSEPQMPPGNLARGLVQCGLPDLAYLAP